MRMPMTEPHVAPPNETAPNAPVQLEHRQVLVVFSGLLLVLLLAALDSTIVSTALPTIVGELGGLEHLAWVVTGYLLAQTIVTPIYGKLGDLYGRKLVLQSAIVLFLAGSALCGMSQSMTQLILFRFVQGLGGGGLNVTTQAAVGDIVSPRERGRYQGIFGAVFGLASIAGPLLGGYFTTHLSWRWIFYVNLPLGIIALVVLAATLPAQSQRRSHAIDYMGAGLLAVVLSALTLVADTGGTAFPWSSGLVLGLIAITVVALVGFIFAERRATEPVLPPHLFGQRTFTLTSLIGLIVGFALFGSVTYLPVYLQLVKGVGPTESGLQMLPMMGGMLVTSIVSGQLISRTGRYKLYPILGTAVMSGGLFLLSRLTLASSTLAASFDMLLLGLGLGLVMQVLVIAVQNSVDYSDLGVATSGATLFRLIGGSLGTAVLGAIFASRLSANLTQLMPAGMPVRPGGGMSTDALARMPAAARAAYLQAFTASLSTVFLVATAVCAVGFLLAWVLPERRLRETIAASAGDVGTDTGGAFGRPLDARVAEAQLVDAFSRLVERQVQRGHIQLVLDRAGETLTPLAAWLLVRVEREPAADPAQLARTYHIPMERIDAATAELRARALIEAPSMDGNPPHRFGRLTDMGCNVLNRLVAARREHLAELVAEWNAEQGKDAATYLTGAVRDMIADVRRPA
jgi:EmrB/QacA subfamily drug resistance transporter